MSDEVELERDGVDPILRYGTTMLLGLLIAGFVAVWLEAGFKNGAAVGVAVGVLIGYLLGRPAPDHDDAEGVFDE